MKKHVLAAVAAAGLISLAFGRRNTAISRVQPELRNAGLWFPLSLRGPITLGLIRHTIPVPPTPDQDDTFRSITIPFAPNAYLYSPEKRDALMGAIVWIHGGGTVAGRPERQHDLCRQIARDAGITVLNIGYRLAPEDPFPAALNDAYTALKWLHDNAAALHVDAERIGVGGESAGGGLAAALAQRAHDTGIPVAFQSLLYPMLDDRTVRRHHHDGRGKFIWTPVSNRYAWKAYLGHDAAVPETRHYAAPGRRDNLAGLPDAWIGVGTLDLFHDEDLDYAHRLQNAGARVHTEIVPGMYHGADSNQTVSSMRILRTQQIAAIKTALN